MDPYDDLRPHTEPEQRVWELTFALANHNAHPGHLALGRANNAVLLMRATGFSTLNRVEDDKIRDRRNEVRSLARRLSDHAQCTDDTGLEINPAECRALLAALGTKGQY